MDNHPATEQPQSGLMPFLTAADLQDHLMTATHDLDRLQTLLSDACDTLAAGFFGASSQLSDLRAGEHSASPTVERAVAHLGTAVTALQFQDMASQLIHHTRGRLRNCADRLARDAFAGDDEGEAAVESAPLRPNPVTQSEMNTGFIELF
ncbi:MAG: hypothetical protein AD742_19095 [Methylibium sp. NZG]|nr:MAG: hypothetical protein AD742_19095 [Methylibium sp. NZG]